MTALRKWDEPQPVKLTVEDFVRLNEAGAFDAYAKTELIEGVIVGMNSQYSSHSRAQSLMLRRLADSVEAVLPGYEAWVEVSVAVSSEDMPEPDIVVTNYRGERAPVPVTSIALVVEIADTTAAYDLGKKARVYAAAGIPEYWVVDLTGKTVHQLWKPGADGYGKQRAVALGEPVEAVTIERLTVETERVLN